MNITAKKYIQLLSRIIIMLLPVYVLVFFPWKDVIEYSNWKYICGRVMGLCGLSLVLAQPLVMGKNPAATFLFGRSRLDFHKRSAGAGFILVLLHPIFLYLGSDDNWPFSSNETFVNYGKIAGIIMLIAIAAYIPFKYKYIKFNTFKLIHFAAIPAVFLALYHAYSSGGTLENNPPIKLFFIILGIISLSSLLFTLIIRLHQKFFFNKQAS